jgi:hypothetical protein
MKLFKDGQLIGFDEDEDFKNENYNPTSIFNYKNFHCRVFAIGSSLDVNVYNLKKKQIFDLYDYKTISEMKKAVKSHIDQYIENN